MELFEERKNAVRSRLRTRLQDAFDVNYTVAQVRIDSMADFEKELWTDRKSVV